MSRSGLVVFGWLGLAGPARAAVVQVGPADDVEAAIAAARPGDEIVLADGEYVLTGRFSISVAGTLQAPIVVRAAAGARPWLHRPAVDQNIVDIDSASWLELRGIRFSGGSAGIRISAADHLTIAGCEIWGTDDVALRANDTGSVIDALHVVDNEIHDTSGTGEGMYLGCNSDACRVHHSVIERNHVHHTNGPGVSQGDGIELKEGSHDNVIRDNVIHDTSYPCILTYGTVGNGGPNVVERNVMWGCGDHGIQSAADAVIRNNLVLSAAGDGIAMQPHQAASPSNLVVTHNTVLNDGGDALSVRSASGSVLVANNALYAQGGVAVYVSGGAQNVALADNVGTGGVSGDSEPDYVEGDLALDLADASFAGAPPMDLFPAPGGALVGAGDPTSVAADDFNTTARDGVADVGAYRYDPNGNPGWALAPTLKGFPLRVALTAGLTPGAPASYTVTGAEAGDRVVLGASLAGVGAGPCPPVLGGGCLDLLPPLVPLGIVVADATGAAVFVGNLPAGVPVGTAISVQAAVPRVGAEAVISAPRTDLVAP